jgi:hypothetical protein
MSDASPSSRYPRAPAALKLKVEPLDPLPELLADVGQRVLRHPAVLELVGRTKPILVSVLPLDEELARKPAREPRRTRFRATLYDAANRRSLLVDGALNAPEQVEITDLATPPRPTREEFEEAARAVRRAEPIRASLREQQMRVYAPMPPHVLTELPDGTLERVVNVGVRAEHARDFNEIVGVRPGGRGVERFEAGAPVDALADAGDCGLPNAGQATVSRKSGSVRVTVTQGSTVLWRFTAVRPAGSSGTNGSGVELRFVDYRGKRVLYRAHVPILNVKYDGDACGPYRDWQNEEGKLQSNGTQVGSTGFFVSPTPATTILDTGLDGGNTLGVAVYVQGQEVVLVSEMQAGWYRYISEWRLHADGTIKPRFGFTGVQNSCICNVHHHHCYWRLDFDLRSAGSNRVREFNDPPLGSGNWHTKAYEIRRPRDPARKRKWRVENTVSGEAYDIIPGSEDGLAASMPDAPFGRGDAWFLRYHANEIDDGSVAIGPPYEAGLDAWVNGERIDNHDVVVWYAGHFTHDTTHEEPRHFGHIVGPTLKLVKW